MRKLLFVLLGLTLLSGIPVNAQSLATVDTRMLLILHPSMMGFDYRNGAFFRESNPDTISKETMKLVSNAQAEARKANDNLDIEIKKLRAVKVDVSNNLIRAERVFATGDILELQKTKKNLISSINDLNSRKAESLEKAELNSSKIAAMEERIAEIDKILDNPASQKPDIEKIAKLRKELTEINGKIALLENKKFENNDKALSAIYLTRVENQKRLKDIKDEINQIIKEVAKKENCNIVIDNTFAIKNHIKKDGRVIIAGLSDNPDVNSAALFNCFLNYKPDISGLADDTSMTDEEKEAHIALGGALNLENQLRQYLEYKNYIPDDVADFTFGSMFVSGGKNITVQCAKRIFDKYKVPEYTRQRFSTVLSEYMDNK